MPAAPVEVLARHQDGGNHDAVVTREHDRLHVWHVLVGESIGTGVVQLGRLTAGHVHENQ